MQKYHKRATFKVRSHRLLCPCTQSLVSGVFSEVLMEDGIFHMMRSPCRGLKGAKKRSVSHKCEIQTEVIVWVRERISFWSDRNLIGSPLHIFEREADGCDVVFG